MTVINENNEDSFLKTILPKENDFKYLDYQDQLIESLHKALALSVVFNCGSFVGYSERILQGYTASLLDAVESAVEASQLLKREIVAITRQ